VSPVAVVTSTAADVLVASFVGPSINSFLPMLGALVVEEGGPLCHAAIVAREFGLPAVIGARGATQHIPDGAMVEVDATAGIVSVVQNAQLVRENGEMLVRQLRDDEQAWRVTTLEQGWGSTSVARLGELIDAATLPALVVTDADDRVGLLTYAIRPDGVEVVTIQALVEGRGVGRALMDHAVQHAIDAHSPRLWLITTNDNVRAIEFYRRWGMSLVRLIEGGVNVSRAVKPSIPMVGANGTPLRDELLFERVLVEK
jgi:phosphohistidine swiveling domain-containing protein